MAPYFLLLLAHGICVAVFLVATIAAGRSFRIPIQEASLFNGPALLRFQIGGVTYRLNILPLGSSVEFAPECESAPLSKRLVLIFSGAVALFLLAGGCLSFETAGDMTLRGFGQIVAGAVRPLSEGRDLWQSMAEFIGSSPFAILLGATAAKECAFNLLPIPPLSGGYALLAVADSASPLSDRFRFRAMFAGLLVFFALMLGWILAGFAGISYQ